MLHFTRVVIDLPLYHRSIVRIGLPYTGPMFIWCPLGGGSWTWDLQFGFAVTPRTPTPDAASAWGIHQKHPHPPERIANWLPRIGYHFRAGLPISSSADHGNHKDYLQLRVDPAGNDANGNPQYDIKITFVHTALADEEPNFDPEIPWWRWWWWRIITWICWWRRPRFFTSSTPQFIPELEDFEKVAMRSKEHTESS